MQFKKALRFGAVGLPIVALLAAPLTTSAMVSASPSDSSASTAAPHTPHNGDTAKDLAGPFYDQPVPAKRASANDQWPAPSKFIAALKKYGISGSKLVLEKDYDKQGPENNARLDWATGKMQAFLFHDTGTGVPASRLQQKHSLNWIMNGNKSSLGKTVRACHFYVDRKGIVHVIYLGRTWHAGTSVSMYNGAVPKNQMNAYSMGVEIESQGGGVWDLTSAQVDSAARVGAAALEAAGLPLSRAINHKTSGGRENDPGRDDQGKTNPQGKVDTVQSAAWWRAKVKAVYNSGGATAPGTSKPAPKPKLPTSKSISMADMKNGKRSESVRRYQVAIRSYLTKKLKVSAKTLRKWNPAGATGYYGAETRKLTRMAILRLGKTRSSAARSWMALYRAKKANYPTKALIKRTGYTPVN